jgi:hypothetical protein
MAMYSLASRIAKRNYTKSVMKKTDVEFNDTIGSEYE